MHKKVIYTKFAATPIGPYNQGIIANGNLLFTSGQIPVNPQTGQIVHGAIDGQTSLVLNNLKAIREAAGSALDHVVKTTVYLADMKDFEEMNAVYEKFFAKEHAPARTCVQVARLPKDVKVEIEAVAVVKPATAG